MGFVLEEAQLNDVLAKLGRDYFIFAPKRFAGGGRFSDTDVVRYGEIREAGEIVYDEKSLYSFKETLMPISQFLFYYSEDAVREADGPKKGAIVFLRSCDLHAVRRLDDMYLHNGEPDYYYERVRENIHFVLMGCEEAFATCFCVDMGSNISDNYELSCDRRCGKYYIDCKWDEAAPLLTAAAAAQEPVTPAHVTETKTRVHIPEHLTQAVMKSDMWRDYDKRCIACGRCNFVCPTCTCFTMQDIYYTDNGRAGERRRVWASCMVDKYTDVAGGGSYRRLHGDRMRFKALHKVLHYKERKGYDMCVGCGRCDDVCPEYISFSHMINRLDDAMKEVESK